MLEFGNESVTQLEFDDLQDLGLRLYLNLSALDLLLKGVGVILFFVARLKESLDAGLASQDPLQLVGLA